MGLKSFLFPDHLLKPWIEFGISGDYPDGLHWPFWRDLPAGAQLAGAWKTSAGLVLIFSHPTFPNKVGEPIAPDDTRYVMELAPP